MKIKWISIKNELPKEGKVVLCRVNFWRYGEIYDAETIEAEYIGMNPVTNHPAFNIETNDEAYAEVTHWMRRETNKILDFIPNQRGNPKKIKTEIRSSENAIVEAVANAIKKAMGKAIRTLSVSYGIPTSELPMPIGLAFVNLKKIMQIEIEIDIEKACEITGNVLDAILCAINSTLPSSWICNTENVSLGKHRDSDSLNISINCFGN